MTPNSSPDHSLDDSPVASNVSLVLLTPETMPRSSLSYETTPVMASPMEIRPKRKQPALETSITRASIVPVSDFSRSLSRGG
jgi:hypothetical protein